MSTQLDDDLLNEEDFECECPCHNPDSKREYRLVQGSSIEGVSVREVYYDDSGEIGCWSDPVIPATGSVIELRDDVEFAIKDFKRMLKAFDKPIIDEIKLEAQIETEE